MKPATLSLLFALVLTLPVLAAEKGEQTAAKKEAGPNGGRLITQVQPNLEFFVTGERKVEVSAVEGGKAIPLVGQVVAVTAGDRSKPTKLDLQPAGGKLVSANTLPAGDGYPVSVSIKKDAAAKPVYEKFTLDLEKCPTCKFQEYACICEHAGERK